MFYVWPLITLAGEAISVDAVSDTLGDDRTADVLWFTTWQAVVSTLARMFVYSISVASLPTKERGTPLIWLMVVAAIAICAWAAYQSAWPAWRMLLILVASGSLLYLVTRYGRSARDKAEPGQP